VQETVYTPEAVFRHPGRLFAEMFRDLLGSRELAWRLMLRDVKVMYRQSLLGYFWAFVPPLLIALPFVLLQRRGTIDAGDNQIPYAAYAMIGLVLWQTFLEALNSPLRILGANRPVLVKVNFPREALLLGGIGVTLFNSAVRVVILAAVVVVARLDPRPSMLLFPIGLLAIVMLGTCIGILLAPLGLLYRDIEKGLLAITTGWLFLTPVVVPLETGGLLGRLMHLNPVTPLLATARDWVSGVPPTLLPSFFSVCGATAAALLLGWILYRASLPHVIARLGM